MTSNVACSTPGCTNPVVGQCGGYKCNCGRFYCAEHSSGRLCPECAARKARDAEVQSILVEYKQKAESLGSKGMSCVGCGTVSGLAFMVSSIPFGLAATVFWDRHNRTTNAFLHSLPPLIFVLSFVAVVAFFIYLESKKVAAINEYDKTHPGFKQFYDAWSSEEDKEDLSKIIAVTAAIGAVGNAANTAYKDHKHERTRQEVEEAARKINRR